MQITGPNADYTTCKLALQSSFVFPYLIPLTVEAQMQTTELNADYKTCKLALQSSFVFPSLKELWLCLNPVPCTPWIDVAQSSVLIL